MRIGNLASNDFHLLGGQLAIPHVAHRFHERYTGVVRITCVVALRREIVQWSIYQDFARLAGGDNVVKWGVTRGNDSDSSNLELGPIPV